jgi:hypothetical protein
MLKDLLVASQDSLERRLIAVFCAAVPPMLHGYGYAYRYRKDTDTRIRQFPEKTDTWIRLIIKKIKINKYNAGLNLKLIAIKLIAIYGRKYYYYRTICLKYSSLNSQI